MKKIIVFAMLIIISFASFSQQTTSSPTLTKQDYLKKSKKQKIVAWSLLLGGFGLDVIAFATGFESESGTFLIRAGTLANLASIPFFIVAHRNKKKGMSLSFKNEIAPQLQKSSFVYRHIPSLTLKMSL
jgi:hypothetical protein